MKNMKNFDALYNQIVSEGKMTDFIKAVDGKLNDVLHCKEKIFDENNAYLQAKYGDDPEMLAKKKAEFATMFANYEGMNAVDDMAFEEKDLRQKTSKDQYIDAIQDAIKMLHELLDSQELEDSLPDVRDMVQEVYDRLYDVL